MQSFTAHLKDNPSVKDCCKDYRNVVIRQEREDLLVGTCEVCGCKHRRFLAQGLGQPASVPTFANRVER
jgi:hypothetical protein